VESRSRGDEFYEKLPFYAALGVQEVWIIDRDSKIPEIYVLQSGQYERQAAGADSWILSRHTGIEMCPGQPGKLAIRLAGDDTSGAELPED
jgi:Uma2 family endonuclease